MREREHDLKVNELVDELWLQERKEEFLHREIKLEKKSIARLVKKPTRFLIKEPAERTYITDTHASPSFS
jgi:hypothetical protein